MTPEEQQLFANAAAVSVTVDLFEVDGVIAATRALEENPKDPIAKEVIKNFSTHLATGEKKVTFAPFLLPEKFFPVDHEADREYARRITGHHQRNKPAYAVVDKVRKFFKPVVLERYPGQQCYEGIFVFMERTGLNPEQIAAMTDAELKAASEAHP